MGVPKRKNNIDVFGKSTPYYGAQPIERRQKLLDDITKSDVYLPDVILHDDLDMGMLEFIKDNFTITTEGEQIPVIPKILTIQKWGEYSSNWDFTDSDQNIKIPFVSVVRKPDVQPGTNPMVQRRIPDGKTFHYSTIPTWDGNKMGADIYKIPQPVAVDITFDIYIVCNRFRDLNKFNKKVLQKFSSRQAYTQIKGHYIPIVLNNITDSSPIDSIDSRRFYIQSYNLTMLGLLIDPEEFEVKPAISRLLLMNEFIEEKKLTKKIISDKIDIILATFIADGEQTIFNVGEVMSVLFNVAINGVIQDKDVHYFHVIKSSKITFVNPPPQGSVITITYYKGLSDIFIDNYGAILRLKSEVFTYDGSSLTFTLTNEINSIVSLNINGLLENENISYEITSPNQITLLSAPDVNSTIGIIYLY